MLQSKKRNIDANLSKPLIFLNLHDSDSYWPTSIKYTIDWFPFCTIMEHAKNIMKTNKGLILSILKLFSMFELCLIGKKIAIGRHSYKMYQLLKKQVYS